MEKGRGVGERRGSDLDSDKVFLGGGRGEGGMWTTAKVSGEI